MNYRVPLSYNSVGEAEIEAANSVLRSGYLTQGAKVMEFEAQLAEFHGVRHAVLVNSGSSANLVGIEAAVYLSLLRPDLAGGPIATGDEVVIQGLNWPSTLKPIVNHGLVPVFCDVDADTLSATPEHIDAVRTERTRMVIAVPVLGNPGALDELESYCRETGLLLFVDGCESLGAVTPAGVRVGSVGLATAFSFYFSHHITTIEGGAILTDDEYLADICFALRAHGWSRNLRLDEFLDLDTSRVDPRFCFVIPGYNVRSTDLNAAVGLVQLRRLEESVGDRQRIARNRVAALAEHQDVVTVPGADSGNGHSWMTFPMVFATNHARDRAQNTLESLGVETRPIIVGNTLRHPLARNLPLSPDQQELPICDAIFERGLMIGLNPSSDEETESWVHYCLREAARAR